MRAENYIAESLIGSAADIGLARASAATEGSARAWESGEFAARISCLEPGIESPHKEKSICAGRFESARP